MKHEEPTAHLRARMTDEGSILEQKWAIFDNAETLEKSVSYEWRTLPKVDERTPRKPRRWWQPL